MACFDALDTSDISPSLSEYDDGVKEDVPDSQGVEAVSWLVKIM